MKKIQKAPYSYQTIISAHTACLLGPILDKITASFFRKCRLRSRLTYRILTAMAEVFAAVGFTASIVTFVRYVSAKVIDRLREFYSTTPPGVSKHDYRS
jgi:hypothetical protein